MQKTFSQINLPDTLSLHSLVKNEFLGRAIARSGQLRLQTFCAYLFTHMGIDEEQLNLETVAMEIQKLKGMAIESPNLIVNSLWKAVPVAIRIQNRSLEDNLLLEEALHRSEFRQIVQRCHYFPLEGSISLQLVLCDSVPESLPSLLRWLSQHLGVCLGPKDVSYQDFRSVFLKEHFGSAGNELAGVSSSPQTRLRLSSLFNTDKIDLETIVAVFEAERHRLKPNPRLLTLQSQKIPIIELSRVPFLVIQSPNPRRRFSNTLHDTGPVPSTPLRKGSFHKLEPRPLARKPARDSPAPDEPGALSQ